MCAIAHICQVIMFAIANDMERSRLRRMRKDGVVLKMHPKTRKLLLELKNWCDQGRGRRAEAARFLDVSPSLITEWFASTRMPTLDHGFMIQDFLKKQQTKK
jgi:hypothetical protein